MCEQYVARAAEPFRIDELWPFTERLERWGLAGFGWGVAWVRADGRLCSHRAARAFRDDTEGVANVGRTSNDVLDRFWMSEPANVCAVPSDLAITSCAVPRKFVP